MLTLASIIKALRQVCDPELGINIIDLGLVYDVVITDNGSVTIRLTLTSINCPLGSQIITDIKQVVGVLPDSPEIICALVWEPAWSKLMLSEVAKAELGVY